MRIVIVPVSIVCLTILTLGAGCGSSTMKVDTIQPKLALLADSRATQKEVKVAVEDFKAARHRTGNGRIIGIAKTGFFNESTDIMSEQPPEQFVLSTVKDGLAKTGIRIVESKDAPYVIGGQVTDFWVEEYATGVSLEYAKACVSFDIVVKDAAGKAVWGTSKQQHETSEKCLDATEKDIPTLTHALAQAVTSVFTDDGFWQAVSK